MLHKYKFAGLTFTFDAFCETGFLWHQPFNYISSEYIFIDLTYVRTIFQNENSTFKKGQVSVISRMWGNTYTYNMCLLNEKELFGA